MWGFAVWVFSDWVWGFGAPVARASVIWGSQGLRSRVLAALRSFGGELLIDSENPVPDSGSPCRSFVEVTLAFGANILGPLLGSN